MQNAEHNTEEQLLVLLAILSREVLKAQVESLQVGERQEMKKSTPLGVIDESLC